MLARGRRSPITSTRHTITPPRLTLAATRASLTSSPGAARRVRRFFLSVALNLFKLGIHSKARLTRRATSTSLVARAQLPPRLAQAALRMFVPVTRWGRLLLMVFILQITCLECIHAYKLSTNTFSVIIPTNHPWTGVASVFSWVLHFIDISRTSISDIDRASL